MRHKLNKLRYLQQTFTVLQIAALAAVSVLPLTGVQAAQLDDRVLTLESSAAGATTGHNFSFKAGTAGEINAVKFEYCSNDPFPDTACTAPTGLNVDDPSGTGSLTLDGQTGTNISGFAINTTDTTANVIVIDRTSGSGSSSVGDTITFDFGSAVNPTTANQEYFVRVYTYSDQGATTELDEGGLAFSTGETITVNARVQETLTFCVYTASTCAGGGTTVDMGVLTSTVDNESEDASKFDVATNARNGMIVQYLGDTLESGTFSIDAIGATATAGNGGGAEQFGVNAATVAAVDGSDDQIGTASTNYNTDTSFAYVTNTATTLAQSSGPIERTRWQLDYLANISDLTETGQYSTTINFIATATF